MFVGDLILPEFFLHTLSIIRTDKVEWLKTAVVFRKHNVYHIPCRKNIHAVKLATEILLSSYFILCRSRYRVYSLG